MLYVSTGAIPWLGQSVDSTTLSSTVVHPGYSARCSSRSTERAGAHVKIQLATIVGSSRCKSQLRRFMPRKRAFGHVRAQPAKNESRTPRFAFRISPVATDQCSVRVGGHFSYMASYIAGYAALHPVARNNNRYV